MDNLLSAAELMEQSEGHFSGKKIATGFNISVSSKYSTVRSKSERVSINSVSVISAGSGSFDKLS